MISILVGGETLDMQPDTSITLKLASPLFAKDLGYNAHSYSFTVPLSARNRRLLEIGALTLAALDAVVEGAVLRYQGLPLFQGNIFVSKVGENEATISLVAEELPLIERMKNVQLSDMELGGYVSMTTTASGISEFFFQWNPGGDVHFFLNDEEIRVDWSDNSAAGSAATALDVATAIDNVAGFTGQYASAGSNSFSVFASTSTGMPFEVRAAADMPHAFDISWDVNSATSHAQVLTHMRARSYAPVGGEAYVFPEFWNPIFYDLNPYAFDLINAWDYVNEVYFDNDNSTQANSLRTTQVPFFQFRWIIEQILMELGGLRAAGQFFDSDDWKRVYGATMQSSDDVRNTFDTNYFRTYMQARDYMPDTPAFDFVSALFQIFNLAMVVVGREARIVNRSQVIESGAVHDWTAHSLVGGVAELGEKEEGRTYTWEDNAEDELWEALSPVLARKLVVGDGKKKVAGEIAPFFRLASPLPETELTTDPLNNAPTSRTVPLTKMRGNSKALDQSAQKVFRMTFYWGVLQDQFGRNYPCASSNDRVGAQTPTAGFALQWEGENGIYKKLHKRWHEANQNPRYSIPLNIPLSQLNRIEFTDRYLFAVRGGTVRGLIEEIQVKLSNTRAPQATAKVLRA